MIKPHNANISASVRARLLNLAKAQGEEFQNTLTRFGIERILYRLSQSEHNDTFVLKGASLFAFWTGKIHRPTQDIDLLGRGSTDPERLRAIFESVCEQPVADDGLRFLTDTIQVTNVREDEQYDGNRITLMAMLGNSRIPIQIDIGFGDTIIPPPVKVEYPTLLDMPSPHLFVYPRETVIAEKFEAMADLGIGNSRMKDFYDIWYLAKQFDFDSASLARAIDSTFERRRTHLPTSPPLALTSEFATDSAKQTQWNAFIKKRMPLQHRSHISIFS